MNPRARFPVTIIGSSLLVSAAMLFFHSQKETSRHDEKPAIIHRSSRKAPSSRPPSEPTTAFIAILRKADPVEQSRDVLPLLKDLAPADYPALLDQCHRQHLKAEADLVKLLLAAWTKADPRAAAAYAHDDESALRAVITTWNATAPANALAWLQAQPGDDRIKALQATTLAVMPGNGRKELGPFLLTMPTPTRSKALGQLAAYFAVQGPDACRQWLESLPDPELHQQALAVVIENSTPERAGEWLLTYQQTLQSSPTNNLYQCFTKWETEDADATRKIFDELPPGTPLHSIALAWLASSREAQNDPHGTYSIIEQYPDEQDGNVLAYFCRSATKSDPELAANISLTIKEPNWETDTILQSWVRQDLAAAKVWIEQHYPEKGARFLQPPFVEAATR